MSHEANRHPGSNGTQAQTSELRPPDPQVIPKAERRRFSAEYKQRILVEADACTERGWEDRRSAAAGRALFVAP